MYANAEDVLNAIHNMDMEDEITSDSIRKELIEFTEEELNMLITKLTKVLIFARNEFTNR